MSRSFYSQRPSSLLLRFAAIACLCILAGLLLPAILGNAKASAALVTTLVFAAPALLFWHFSGGITSGLGLHRPLWRAVVFAALAALALQPLLQFTGTFTRDLLETCLPQGPFSRLSQAQSLRETAIGRIVGNTSWISFPLSALLLGVFPAVCEEFFFRGTLQRLFFRLSHRRHLAVIAVALAFTAVHLDWFNVAGIFLCALFLGYLYLYTSNIWIPIAFHLASNLWNIFLVYTSAQAAIPVGQQAPAEHLIPWWAALASLAFAFLLAKTACKMYSMKQGNVSPHDE